jgi:hypothetical protein
MLKLGATGKEVIKGQWLRGARLSTSLLSSAQAVAIHTYDFLILSV